MIEDTNIKKVAVIGAGLMGSGVVAEFIRFGYSVAMYNTRKDTSRWALGQVKKILNLAVKTNLISSKNATESYSRLYATVDLEEALKNADFVHESVPEQLRLKQAIFKKLDISCPPSTILATNSSSFLGSNIAILTNHPERVIATHYYQPPQFIPLVEVVPTPKTAPEVTRKTVNLLKNMRKKVIIIPKETPGFIGNRIQSAIEREIKALVDNGIATPEMIDDVIQFGFGRRMAFTGYFKRIDLIGLDFLYNLAIEKGVEPWEPLATHVKNGELGMKTGNGFYKWTKYKINKLHYTQNIELIRLLKQDIKNNKI